MFRRFALAAIVLAFTATALADESSDGDKCQAAAAVRDVSNTAVYCLMYGLDNRRDAARDSGSYRAVDLVNEGNAFAMVGVAEAAMGRISLALAFLNQAHGLLLQVINGGHNREAIQKAEHDLTMVNTALGGLEQ